MKTKLALFCLVALMCLPSAAWWQQVLKRQMPTSPPSQIKTDFQKVVEGYVYGSLSDERIVKGFTELSEKGDPRATLWLARMHLNGWCGFDESPGHAYELAEPVVEQVVKLADADDHDAQFLVGYCHHVGFVLEQNATTAAEWYAKAVKGQQLNTYGNLATILAEGEGVKADIGQARRLLERGASLGSKHCRGLLDYFAQPTTVDMKRFRELRQHKVVQALGLEKEAVVRMLTEAGLVTVPDAPIEYPEGLTRVQQFEDDGIVLHSSPTDGIVRCIDVYWGMSSRDDPRAAIPLGINWDDSLDDVKAKLGKPDGMVSLFEGMYARLYSYQVGNILFSVGYDMNGDNLMKCWRVRQLWQEDFPDEK